MEDAMKLLRRLLCPLLLAALWAAPAGAWSWGHPTYTPRTQCWQHPCWNDAMDTCIIDLQASHPGSYYARRYGPARRWSHRCFSILTRSCHRRGTDVLTCNGGDSAGGAF